MDWLLALLLIVVLCFAAALLYALITYWLDRYEKEPKMLLGCVFTWGTTIAVVGALIGEEVLGQGVLILTSSKSLAEFLTSSMFAPLVEESLKGLAVLLVFLALRHEFDSILDGIVYAGIVALGFAAVENVVFTLGTGYLESGLVGLFKVFFLRGILGAWNHALYTAFFGIGLAMARLTHNLLVKVFAPIVGWMMAILVHSLHNTLLAVPGGCLLAFPLNWSGWLFMLGVVIWAIREEGRGIATHLQDEAKEGIITAAQHRTAISSWRQTGARFRALSSGRYRVTSRFYQVCGELAHKKRQRSTLGEESGTVATIQRLRAELTRLSPLALA